MQPREEQADYRAEETEPLRSDIGRFAIVPEWLIPIASASALKLYAWLASRYADQEGVAWPGQERIAEELGLTSRTVRTLIASLRSLGAISTQRRGLGLTNIMVLHRARSSPETTHLLTEAEPHFHSETGASFRLTRPIEPDPINQIQLDTQQKLKKLTADEVWPDWYGDLYSIPGFKRSLEFCRAWLAEHDISEAHADSVASALKGMWPGPPRRPYRDAWATFRNWAKRPPLGGESGVNGGHPQEAASNHNDESPFAQFSR